MGNRRGIDLWFSYWEAGFPLWDFSALAPFLVFWTDHTSALGFKNADFMNRCLA
jgi:hypothetical protein